MTTRKEIIDAASARYRESDRKEKVKILDEFVALTGFHRKHAIRVLNCEPKPNKKRVDQVIYDEAVLQALRVIWEAADRICGKRLKAAMPLFIETMEKHGHLALESNIRDRLLSISAASIDRLLKPTRTLASRKKRQQGKVDSTLRRSIPVKTFSDWQEVVIPGFFQMDFVQHCGGMAEGSFVHSLMLTDIASGWTECLALPARDQSLVVAGLAEICNNLPFTMLGFNSDNDSAFINETVLKYACEHGLKFTRSRPYRKNDQAWIEQKNGAVARRLVGYGRLEGLIATQSLATLYRSARLYVNFFQPSMQLKSKTREGSQIKKRYFAPMTPCEKLLAFGHLDEASANRLSVQRSHLDPITLLKTIRSAQEEIASLGNEILRANENALSSQTTSTFMSSLTTAWQAGEVRPTHRQKRTTPRHWKTRDDPFEHAWPTIESWLQENPSLSATELMEKLNAIMPDGYTTKSQLRTLQRRVKEWRRKQAEELIFFTLKNKQNDLSTMSQTCQ